MSELDLLQSVTHARNYLTALRARLEGEEGIMPESPGLRSAVGDILELLDRLQAHYGLMDEILDRTGDAFFAKDRNGRYVLINQAGAWMFGKDRDAIIGQDDTALLETECAERVMTIDRLVMSTGKPSTFEQTIAIRGVQSMLLTTETAWYEPGGGLCGIIGTARDVTEQRQAERLEEGRQDRLRSLASEIVITEEHLRQAVAADLHDNLGQDIALAKMKLAALRSSSSADIHDAVAQVERLVEQADRSLRSIAFRLGPPILHTLGLVPALQWLAEDMRDRCGLDVRIAADAGAGVADPSVRVILFRAVRELLDNTAVHAGVGEALVRIGTERGLLRIIVEDRGKGFDVAQISLRGHGLFGIREQLRHAGGSMHVDSSPGRGTTVTLTAPASISGGASTG